MSYVCFLYPVIFSFESKRPDWQQNNLGCFFCTAIVWGWGSSPTFCLCFMSDAHEHQNSDCSGMQNVHQMGLNPTPIWDGWILLHHLTVSHFFSELCTLHHNEHTYCVVSFMRWLDMVCLAYIKRRFVCFLNPKLVRPVYGLPEHSIEVGSVSQEAPSWIWLVPAGDE